MKSTVYFIICISVILLVFSIAIWCFHQEGFSTVLPLEKRNCFIVHEQELVPREKIDAFLATPNNIYIYYDKSALVNIYSSNGAFEYGIQIWTMKNGRGDIAFQDGVLYINSHGASIAAFSGKNLLGWIDHLNDYETYSAVSDLFDNDKNHMLGKEMLILSPDESKLLLKESKTILISFPQKSRIAESLVIICLLLICLAIGVYRKFY